MGAEGGFLIRPGTVRAAVSCGLRNALVLWSALAVAAVVLSWLPVNMAYVR